MSDQPVHLADYDGAWPDRFADQQARVAVILAPWLAAPVEHIGSTSVPGLTAKPVIDMLGPVRSLASARDAVGPLAEDGWLFWPDDPCGHYRLWFLRPRPQARTHHLHLIEHGDPHAGALIAFRDALRSDPGLCAEYAALKIGLASQHRENRNAYTNAKGEFVARVVRGDRSARARPAARVGAWAGSGWPADPVKPARGVVPDCAATEPADERDA
jgi:GrpB-like predicted nucleotidyltransferase (UPF0157 family)